MREKEHLVRVIYVAGKFRGPDAWAITNNTRRAEEIGFEIAKLGAMPLIPHMNTANFHGALPDQFWLDGTLELLRRCDAVMTVPLWEQSTGARGEIEEAMGKMPIFHDLVRLDRWLKTGKL